MLIVLIARSFIIVTMTDKAANKTMDLTESIIESVSAQSNTFDQITTVLNSVIEDANLPSTLTKSLKTTIKQVTELTDNNNDLQSKLTEILIAQDYQDLTGQVIFKVTKLLKSLETDLAQLIDRFGQVLVDADQAEETKLKGPLSEADEEKSSQGDVDDLLTKFGF